MVIVAIVTFLAFVWRTILAIRSRTYQITEKQLADRIRKMFDEKTEDLSKIIKLKKQAKEGEKKLKDSEESRKALQYENKRLKVLINEATLQQDALQTQITTSEKENALLKELKKSLQLNLQESQQKCKDLELHKHRIQELEDEKQKIERFFRTRMATLEKMVQNNWLAARISERALAEEKQKSSSLHREMMNIKDVLDKQYRHLPKPTPGWPNRPVQRVQGPPPQLYDYPPMEPYGQDWSYPPHHLYPGAILPPTGAVPPSPHGQQVFHQPTPGFGYVVPEVSNCQMPDLHLDISAEMASPTQQAPVQQDTVILDLDP